VCSEVIAVLSAGFLLQLLVFEDPFVNIDKYFQFFCMLCQAVGV
jgi:hypothetical protein